MPDRHNYLGILKHYDLVRDWLRGSGPRRNYLIFGPRANPYGTIIPQATTWQLLPAHCGRQFFIHQARVRGEHMWANPQAERL